MRYYIADCHFGHDAVRVLDGRPFETVDGMDAAMVDAWNEVVRKGKDEVIILGDFCFGSVERVEELLCRLHGKKYLIEGNHDRNFLRKKRFRRELFEWIKPYAELRDNNRRVIVCHYPILCYNGQYRGDHTYMLYGHVHDTMDYQNICDFRRQMERCSFRTVGRGVQEEKRLSCNVINCFTQFSDYRPLTLDQWIAVDQERKKGYDGI